jgi:hypothetical protein
MLSRWQWINVLARGLSVIWSFDEAVMHRPAVAYAKF